MNLPNKLTVLRMCMVPFFVAALLWQGLWQNSFIALVLFAGAPLTDLVDGQLARKNGQVTTFGKFLDPLADKILVLSALVCFVALGFAEVWAVLVILAREFMVTSIRLVAAGSGKVVAANFWGKFKTVSQIAAIGVILALQYIQELAGLGIIPVFSVGSLSSGFFFTLIGHIFILVCTFFTVLSGAVYLKQNFHFIRNTK